MSNPDPTAPHACPRHILVAVEAYSPQTITEALYALSQTTQPPWIPTEVHIITTERGYDLIRQALLHAGWLERVCQDYALPAACMTPAFHLITDAQGQKLWDVRSKQDNEHTADFITRQIRDFTADPASSVCALLSGGRRSMTYYIGYALSLFGRPQDRLTHVLVDDCYFFLDDFYYPPPQTRWQQDRSGTEFDASKVEITLADIPFLRLRDGLPDELLAGSSSFSATISTAQRRFDPLSVQLDWQNASLRCGGVPIPMPPVQLAFYAWMLQRRMQGLPPVRWADAETPPLAEQFLTVYQRLHGLTGSYEQVAKALAGDGMTKAYFEERKSGVNASLKKALGAQVAEAYLLHPHGSRPVTRFGVRLPMEVVQLNA